jgi:serine protease AprX
MATALSDPITHPAPQAPQTRSACGLLAISSLLVGWFGLASPLAAGLSSLIGTPPTSLARGLTGLVLLVLILVVPLGAGLVLAHRKGWTSLKPVVQTLLIVTGYALAAIAIRAVGGANEELEAGLRLGGLILVAIAAGMGLARATLESPESRLRALGLTIPSLAGLALGSTLLGLMTVGWPLTGALGDRWDSLSILWQSLAEVLPEEFLFRGVVLGFLLRVFPQQKLRAAIISLLIYLAFIPSRILPTGDWGAVGSVFVLIPLALLTMELRVRTGSIWAGLLVAWLYRAMPQLFTDPRDEIMDPAQWLAGGWMVIMAGGLAIILWLVRRRPVQRQRFSKGARLRLAALLATVTWAGWFGTWVVAGEPGFHDDGFIIMMSEQADVSAAYDIAERRARRAYVYDTLVQTAQQTQPPLRDRLTEAGFSFRPYYLVNMIYVSGYHRQRNEFADLPGVAYVRRQPDVRPYPTYTALGIGPAPERTGLDWNLRRLEVERVWDMGYRGQGIVIGGQDTGYDWDHPALKRSYRGWDPVGGTADHNFNWHDAWDETSEPHDDGSHGTHTLGIMVGDDGRGNQIGLAPGAQWMGCRNMRRGIGNPASYTECMEFFLAPYPLDGDPFSAGDVARGPDVVNNSWGCPDFEGCEDNTLEPALEALRAAGIMMVVSAGNEGPACGTVTEPPARYEAVLSVGATDQSGTITFFSSRGPVSASDGDPTLLKPDIVAPGFDIRSSIAGSGYGTASGTSMAGPHVTGLVALLWSAWPDLKGDIAATQAIIRQSANPVEVSATCSRETASELGGGFFSQVFAALDPEVCSCGEVDGVPNNVYGWGEINAWRAVELALGLNDGN